MKDYVTFVSYWIIQDQVELRGAIVRENIAVIWKHNGIFVANARNVGRNRRRGIFLHSRSDIESRVLFTLAWLISSSRSARSFIYQRGNRSDKSRVITGCRTSCRKSGVTSFYRSILLDRCSWQSQPVAESLRRPRKTLAGPQNTPRRSYLVFPT